MFRKKDKNQGIPDGVVGNNLKNARLTKKEREEIATTERKRIASKVNSLRVISQVRSVHF